MGCIIAHHWELSLSLSGTLSPTPMPSSDGDGEAKTTHRVREQDGRIWTYISVPGPQLYVNNQLLDLSL